MFWKRIANQNHFLVVHLLCHSCNSCKTRRIKKVEHQEAECCQSPVGNQLATPAATFTASSVSPATFARTPMVETIASFAVKPEIEAATGCHSPKPRGAKRGAITPPIASHKAVCALFYHTEATVFESKSTKEPHYYAGKEQDRTSFDDEAFQSFPYMKQNGLSLTEYGTVEAP